MKIRATVLLVSVVGLPMAGGAQTTTVGALDFEAGAVTALEWHTGQPAAVSLDSAVYHAGRRSLRIESDSISSSESTSFAITVSVPAVPSGGVVQLRGWLRGEGLDQWAGLWLRQDGAQGMLQFDDEQARITSTSSGWRRVSVSLSLDPRAVRFVFGGLLTGTGRLWVDDLELVLIGQRLHDDQEFDAGSRIDVASLSDAEVERLIVLAKVWGFVKYHHPRVTAGELNWDYELFRVLPRVLNATDRAAAADEMVSWLSGLGEPDPCDPCATPPIDVALTAPIAWIGDEARLGTALSDLLEAIHRSRPASGRQRYVQLMQSSNPIFPNEAAYPEQRLPDAGFRLLSLIRLWNVVEYWFPYRDIIGEDWERVFGESVPEFVAARTEVEYKRAIMRVLVRLNDTHANLWGDLDVRPPMGDLQVPLALRMVEGLPVVVGYTHPTLGPATSLQRGDVIEAVDGVPVDSLFARWRNLYSASNEATRLRDMTRSLLRGRNARVQLQVRRAGDRRESITVERAALSALDLRSERTSDLPGPAFQMLTDEVAYLKLSAVEADEAAEYVRRAQRTSVWVIDIRGYPSEFVVFALGQHLVREPTPFARFTRGDLANPGAFLWGDPVRLEPTEPTYDGAVVILVDENSMSQSEYTAMAFRAAPNAMVVGSTTAGADGNISAVPLPGDVRQVVFSGIGVFYPDGTPTQRIGIVPDLVVRPTIAGLREGRDEVLEAAVGHVLGRPFRLPPGIP